MRRYSISQLEAFAAIAECGTFRRAAERLGITQPTISLRIRELEAGIGEPLFLRGKGGVRLSSTGQVMLQYVRRGLGSFDEMENRLKAGDPLTGVLRLGSSNTFALSCLAPVLSALEGMQPGLNVELTITNSNTLARLLAEHKLDVAFLSDAPVPPQVSREPLAQCEIAWVASPDARLGARLLRPHELARTRIMTLPAPSPFHTVISDWFAAAGEPLPTLSTCNDMSTILRLVRSGAAVSVMPTSTAGFELQAGTLMRHRASPALPPMKLYVAYQAAAWGHFSEAILRIARDAVAHPNTHMTPI